MNYIFISYAGDDYKIAKEIEKEINHKFKSILNAKLVEDRKEGDTTFTEKVIDYFKLCNVCIVILTNNSVTNQFVNQEWGYAKCLKEFGQIQVLLHITEIDQNMKRVECKGFISTNMDFIDLKYENEIPRTEEMISEIIELLNSKKDTLRPIYTEKQGKLKRCLDEIERNITLQSELISKENDFRGKLGINPSSFLYDYSLHIIDIGHFFSNDFIERIMSYINILIELNIRKQMMIDWAISRGCYHEGNTSNFYNMLKATVKEFQSIKKFIKKEYKIFA